MDDFSILTLTEMDMPTETEELRRNLILNGSMTNDEIILTIRNIHSNLNNILNIINEYQRYLRTFINYL